MLDHLSMVMYACAVSAMLPTGIALDYWFDLFPNTSFRRNADLRCIFDTDACRIACVL